MPDDFAGATMSLTNPGGLARGLGSPPHGRPGQHHRSRGHRLSGGVLRRVRGPAPRFRRQQGHDGHQHLRPPRHPGRRVGGVLATVDRLLQGDQGFYELHRREPGPRRGRLSSRPRPPPRRARTPPGRWRQRCCITSPPRWRWSKAFRMHGHLAAHLEPLGSSRSAIPRSIPGRSVSRPSHGAIPARCCAWRCPGETLAEAYLPRRRPTAVRRVRVEHIATTRSASGSARRSRPARIAADGPDEQRGCCSG